MPKQVVNAFSLFVEEMARIKGVPLRDGFQAFAKDWANLPEAKKNVYKERARASKMQNRQSGRTDCRGRDLCILEKETAERQQRQKEIIESIRVALGLFDDDVDGGSLRAEARRKAILETAFVVVHINMYSKVDNLNSEVLPAEIALVEFSLKNGIRRSWHAFIAPENIPKGYSYICKTYAETSHQIPLRDFEMAVQDRAFIRDKILGFLQDGPDTAGRNGRRPLPVLYCMSDEEEVFAKALEQMLGEPYLRLFDLAELAFELEAAIEDLAARHPSPDIVGPRLNTVVEARLYLENDPFLFQTEPADSCGFHCPLENVAYCSLSIVKRRVFAIAQRSSAAMSVKLEKGKHLPSGRDAKLPLLAPDQVVSKAVVRDYVSPFGVELPRGDVRGGSTPLPDIDPAAVIESLGESRSSLYGSRNSSSRCLSSTASSTVLSATNVSSASSADLSTTFGPLNITDERSKLRSRYHESFSDKVKATKKH